MDELLNRLHSAYIGRGETLFGEAADAIRAQSARIADLEAEVERLLRENSQLDDEIMRLEDSME